MKILPLLIAFYLHPISAEQKNSRIIGGEVAAAGQYKFLAAIYKNTPEGTYFCSGSLINQRWILTAGQCVDGATLFTVYLGTINIKNLDSTSLKLATDEYVLHPEYNPLTLDNDIGLIKLRMNVTFTDYIRSVGLAMADLATNIGLQAVGWGQTSDESSSLSDELHWVKVVTVSNQECKITYGDQITDNMVCITGSYNEGACHGDTGSPVVFPYRGGTLLHQGIASFVSGNGCESPDPSGYTRTYPYLDWIRNVSRQI